jgi:hypothetical protein
VSTKKASIPINWHKWDLPEIPRYALSETENYEAARRLYVAVLRCHLLKIRADYKVKCQLYATD